MPHTLLQFCRIRVKLILGTIHVQSSQVIHNALYRKIITVYSYNAWEMKDQTILMKESYTLDHTPISTISYTLCIARMHCFDTQPKVLSE